MKLNPLITLAIVVLTISQAVQAWVAIQPTAFTLQQKHFRQVHGFCEDYAKKQEGRDQREIYIACWKKFK